MCKCRKNIIKIKLRGESAILNGKISGKNHPFIEHFKYVKGITDKDIVVRQTIPSPTQFLLQLLSPDNIENTKEFYPDKEELIQDIVKAYKTVIKDLYEAGCRNVQFDDCSWGRDNFLKVVLKHLIKIEVMMKKEKRKK